MKFPLATFTTTLDTALVEKGKKWYSEGMVQHVQNVNECVWHAQIIGPNKQFNVQVEIVGKNVIHVFCNCGPTLCSHVVSLLFELVEKNYPTEKHYSKGKNSKQGALKVMNSPLEKALQNIDVDDLKDFIKEYAKTNQEFKELFLNEFSKIDIESHVKRFRSIINSTSKYEGNDAMDGTRAVLYDAEKNFKGQNYEVVFAACKAVLTEWAPIVYMSKHAGFVFSDALKQLHVLVKCKGLSEPLKHTLLNFIYQLYKSPDIQDYQDGEFWTDAFISLATSKDQLQKVATVIDAKLEKASESNKRGFLKHKQVIEEAIRNY